MTGEPLSGLCHELARVVARGWLHPTLAPLILRNEAHRAALRATAIAAYWVNKRTVPHSVRSIS
jgi:hypothetical protein